MCRSLIAVSLPLTFHSGLHSTSRSPSLAALSERALPLPPSFCLALASDCDLPPPRMFIYLLVYYLIGENQDAGRSVVPGTQQVFDESEALQHRQGLVSFFSNGPGSKYLGLGGPHSLCCDPSAVPLQQLSSHGRKPMWLTVPIKLYLQRQVAD